MRDIKRIDRILKKIETAWKNNLDMRFGQLLINLCIIEDNFPTWIQEDEELEKRMDADYNGLFNKKDTTTKKKSSKKNNV